MPEDHPFAALAGTWAGEGAGSYPTIQPFTYREQLEIEPVPGRPIAHWRSRTRDATTGEPRHAESGFLRAGADGAVELVVAHTFGIVEVGSGTFAEGRLEVDSGELVSSPTAKRVDHVQRSCRFEGDTLTYEVAMAAVGEPMTHHLQATLHR
jgi:hypothetical protein